MALFDRNRTFDDDLTPEFVDTTNVVVERLRARLAREITLGEPGSSVRCYLQAHVRRCLMFVDAGLAELDAARPLITEMCTRALYENIATICAFSDKLKSFLDQADYSGLEKFVEKSAFATRIPSFLERYGADLAATNIITHIEKMKRRYESFQTAYDHLSDIVHPNGLGAVVYFAKIEPGLARFSDSGNNPARALDSLLIATFLLLYVETALIEIDDQLAKFRGSSAGIGP
jgi:hypothetical protein